MSININNWEAFAVDYFDGTLSAAKQEELLSFIDSHPEIKDEFYSYQDFAVIPEKVVYQEKKSLKHPYIFPFGKINESNFEEYIVLFVDNELSQDEKSEFLGFIEKNNFLKKNIKTIAATRLQPDKNTFFPDKNSLKKEPVVSVLIKWSSVAAILVAGIILLKPYFFSDKLPTHNFTVSVYPLPALNYGIPKFDDTIKILPVQKSTIGNFKSEKAEQRRSKTVEPLNAIENNLLLSELNDNEILNSGYFASPPQGISADNKKSNDRSLAMKVISRPIKNIGTFFAKRKRKSKQSEYKEPAAVKLIDNGITVLNKITGSDIIVAKVYTNGNLTKYQLEGNNWQIKRKLGRR